MLEMWWISVHIAALQWESEPSMKRDSASGHTYDDIRVSLWWWWCLFHKSFVVVVMMMMTYESLGDYNNDDSDYQDTPSTLRTMKIKIWYLWWWCWGQAAIKGSDFARFYQEAKTKVPASWANASKLSLHQKHDNHHQSNPMPEKGKNQVKMHDGQYWSNLEEIVPFYVVLSFCHFPLPYLRIQVSRCWYWSSLTPSPFLPLLQKFNFSWNFWSLPWQFWSNGF